MKKLLYLLALLLPLAGFTQNTRAFYGSSISRSYGVDTLAGFKAVNTNTLGYAGLVAISAADTSAFFTNGTGHASIYNSAGVLRQPQYVGVGGSPDVSGTAYLSLTGTTGGFLTARMTAAQKNAIGSPATGLLIYQTDGTAGFYYYNGSAWGAVGGASGITVGTTTITSGTSRRIPYNLAGVYQEAANELYFESASPYAHVYAGGRTGVITGLNNSFFGREAGKLVTTGDRNTFFGAGAGAGSPSSTSSSTLVGFLAGGNNPGGGLVAIQVTTGGITSTGSGVVIGNDANVGNGGSNTAVGPLASTIGSSNAVALGASATTTGDFSPTAVGAFANVSQRGGIALGAAASVTHLGAAALGVGAATSQNNELMIGGSAGYDAFGFTNICIGNGNAYTSASNVSIRTTAGSGSNSVGGSLTFYTRSTGNATPPNIIFQTGTTLASGTTLQTAATRFTIGELRLTATVPVKMQGYTVATLPTGSVGDIAYVTDATAPTYLGALTGGGAVATPVFYNGAAWVSY